MAEGEQPAISKEALAAAAELDVVLVGAGGDGRGVV